MMRHILGWTAILVWVSAAAWAQTPAPDAVPDGASYPDPQCTRPQMDLVRPESTNSAAVGTYNMKVKKFNQQTAAYSSCVHDYVDKANHDVQRIQDKANADLKEISARANASMKAIEDKVRQALADANTVSASLNQEADKLRAH